MVVLTSAGLRYVAADEFWLSPMYQRNISVVSMIVLGNATETGSPAEFQMYAQGLASIARKYGGRPHWGKLWLLLVSLLAPQHDDVPWSSTRAGKMNWATKEYLSTVYPKFNDFVALAKEVDPQGIFVNDYLAKTLGL